MHDTTPPPDSEIRRPYTDLFLVSFLILFFELACIRWFGSTVVFLTFFTNIVLMACFVGMSVGCMTASRPARLIRIVTPTALVSVVLAMGLLWGYQHVGGVMIRVGDQASPQLIYFGTEYRSADLSRFVVPIEVVAGGFFTLVAVMFVGMGQVMGRAFTVIRNRVQAYLANIVGSLAGIAAFAGVSMLQLRPVWWFAISLAIVTYFARKQRVVQTVLMVAVLGLVAFSGYVDPTPPWMPETHAAHDLHWSPYYKVRHNTHAGGINTNNIAHQHMLDVKRGALAYSLPYLMARDAGGEAATAPERAPFKNVLIIGAGSGNDVAAALAFGAEHVDAVEIDPVIQRLGRDHHPLAPYADHRVTVHLDDGRSFLRKTDRRYDLVIYALVDSLVLQSGYSSLRLESFLFTKEAFTDVRNVLAPGGVFAMYNYYRQWWVVGRLVKMAQEQFGTRPLVFSLPYQAVIDASSRQFNHWTFVLVGNRKATAVDAIAREFAQGRFYCPDRDPSKNTGGRFGPRPPATANAGAAGNRLVIGPAKVDTSSIARLPSDDWPHIYNRDRSIPGHCIRGVALIAALSILILFAFAPKKTMRPGGQMFFLGAGFMLLETKGVVHLALLFGSTWVVNSIVFFSILVMIVLANLYVLRFKPGKLTAYYALLMAALLVNALVPTNWFLALPGAARTVASCAVIFVPIFFAGVIFATAFSRSIRPDQDMGANIMGVVLGGLSEYLSMMVGFNWLILLAMGYYFLSAALAPGARIRAGIARGADAP